jgi:hypothetical protein
MRLVSTSVRSAAAAARRAVASGVDLLGAPAAARARPAAAAAAAARRTSAAVLRRLVTSMAAPVDLSSWVVDGSKPLLSTDCRSGKRALPDAVDLVLYHGGGCPDGFAAAFAAWSKLGDQAQYVPCEHGPGARIPDVAGRHVAVVDFCFDAATTARMIRDAASFIVLDHHASAQVELADVGDAWKVFEMRQSGATLAWDFFHATPPPLLLRYVEDKDIWRWALRSTAEVTAGLASVPHSFAAWAGLVAAGDAGVTQLAAKGAAITAYKQGVVEGHVRRAVPCRLAAAPQFQGMIVNGTTVASEIGNALATLPGVDFGLIWTYEHAKSAFRVSLRSSSDAVDVSLVAKHFAGGGHRRAAGFSHTGASITELLLTGEPVLPGREAALEATMQSLPAFSATLAA